MSAERETGGPAYPHPVAIGPGGDVFSPHDVCAPGMSLRDWFAGQFAPHMAASLAKANREDGNKEPNIAGITAKLAYDYADAMLAERSQP